MFLSSKINFPIVITIIIMLIIFMVICFSIPYNKIFKEESNNYWTYNYYSYKDKNGPATYPDPNHEKFNLIERSIVKIVCIISGGEYSYILDQGRMLYKVEGRCEYLFTDANKECNDNKQCKSDQCLADFININGTWTGKCSGYHFRRCNAYKGLLSDGLLIDADACNPTPGMFWD